MSPRWSRLLELLGRIGLGGVPASPVTVGHPGAPDAQGGRGWLEYATAERLYDVWGPVPGSPWVPFHCVPLFAALDRIPQDRVGPMDPEDREPALVSPAGPPSLPVHARPGAAAPAFVTPDTWAILDLPGPRAVEAGAWLVMAALCQPVCTFDHWPHPRGLLKPEDILEELLRWATTVAAARARLAVSSPPLWICDSDRLGVRGGVPGEFDNRYYLDDSILPGPGILTRGGVRRVTYVTLSGEAMPTLDLEGYFADLLAAGHQVLHVSLSDPGMEPRPFAVPLTNRPPPRTGFRRSAAGGFGTEVPEPSSSGG